MESIKVSASVTLLPLLHQHVKLYWTVRPVRALLSCSTSKVLCSKDKSCCSKPRLKRDSSTLWASKCQLETAQGSTSCSYFVPRVLREHAQLVRQPVKPLTHVFLLQDRQSDQCSNSCCLKLCRRLLAWQRPVPHVHRDRQTGVKDRHHPKASSHRSAYCDTTNICNNICNEPLSRQHAPSH